MSYVLTAVFGRPDALAGVTHPLLAPTVQLGAGFAMRPVIDPFDLVDDEDDDDVLAPVRALRFDPLDADAAAGALGWAIAPATGRSPIAYVHMERFGGTSDEAVCVWRGGELVWRAAGEELDEPLSPEAFRTIGVEADDGVDAFDALGLGRHRRTEAWIGEP